MKNLFYVSSIVLLASCGANEECTDNDIILREDSTEIISVDTITTISVDTTQVDFDVTGVDNVRDLLDTLEKL